MMITQNQPQRTPLTWSRVLLYALAGSPGFPAVVMLYDWIFEHELFDDGVLPIALGMLIYGVLLYVGAVHPVDLGVIRVIGDQTTRISPRSTAGLGLDRRRGWA